MGRMGGVPASLTAVLAAVALLCLPAAGAVHIDARPAAALNGLKVTGNRITDASGKPVMLRGVNRSGTEYACQQGWGIFDGASDSASVLAMTTWHINYVRVLLNEDCWLAINGIDPSLSGSNYQTAINDYVDLLNSNGIYVELSLIMGAPGTHQAYYQPPAPDASHSPAFWTSVATYFKSNPDVFFGIWGEPANIDWNCWENGCSNEATWCAQTCVTPITYATAGSQSLVDAIRATGATQVISVPGIDYANDLSQWSTYEPADPLNQLIAEEHVYGDNTCGAATQLEKDCLNNNTAPLTATVPVIFGETGESVFSDECGDSRMQFLLPWADAHNIGYAAWVWDTWSGDCLSLITDYNGTVNSTDPAGTLYATYYHDHLLAVTAGRTPSSQTNPASGTPRPIIMQAPLSTPGGRTALIAVLTTEEPIAEVKVAPRSRPARVAPGFRAP